MRKGIHPESKVITINCSCGAVYSVTSVKGKDYSTEICSACHPFFTGKQKIMDTAGRIEKFNAKYKRANHAAEK